MSPNHGHRSPCLQRNLFSLQTPHLSTCQWNHSQCWRTTLSRSTALQRPTQLSPSTGKSPADEAQPGPWTPPNPCQSHGVSFVVPSTQRTGWFTVGTQDPSPSPAGSFSLPRTPIQPWPFPFLHVRAHFPSTGSSGITPSAWRAWLALLSEKRQRGSGRKKRGNNQEKQ